MSLSKLFALLLVAVLTTAATEIPPLVTLEALRGKLSDDEFVIDPSAGGGATTPNFTLAIASAAEFPLLGFSDVDGTVTRVTLFAGATFFTHLHPRATEFLFALRGDLMVSLQTEGFPDPRVIMNTVSTGNLTVFPQGLPQTIVCVNIEKSCEYVSFLNSADPGVVAV